LPPCHISPEALADLQTIYDFIASDSLESADRVAEEFFSAFDRLAALPQSGHSRPDLTSRDVRFWPVRSYLVIYRESADSVQVVAILHGSRDIPSVLESR